MTLCEASEDRCSLRRAALQAVVELNTWRTSLQTPIHHGSPFTSFLLNMAMCVSGLGNLVDRLAVTSRFGGRRFEGYVLEILWRS